MRLRTNELGERPVKTSQIYLKFWCDENGIGKTVTRAKAAKDK